MAGCSKDPHYPEDDSATQFLEHRENMPNNVEEDSEDDVSKTTSDYTDEEPEPFVKVDETKVQECVDQIREKLITSAEMEKLTSYLDKKLADCGWKADLHKIITAEIRKKKGQELKLEEIYDLVKEKGKQIVPAPLQREMVWKIQQSYDLVKDKW